MTPAITATTRLIALLGDPVAHSLSPTFQNAAFGAAGVDGVYLALRCDGASVGPLLRTIAAAGGAGNVTVPHKERAAESLDVATGAVQRTGACNTFWLEGGRVCGDNTDVRGFVEAARALLPSGVQGSRVLLIGAGGAARGALLGLIEERADQVVIMNRTAGRARDLVSRFGALPGADLRTAATAPELVGERFDLAVNATSLGMGASLEMPLALDGGPELGAALDMVYSPEETAWVRALRNRGVAAVDGREMLLQQGAEAFRRWWGFDPALDVMREALERVR